MSYGKTETLETDPADCDHSADCNRDNIHNDFVYELEAITAVLSALGFTVG